MLCLRIERYDVFRVNDVAYGFPMVSVPESIIECSLSVPVDAFDTTVTPHVSLEKADG